MAIDNSEQEQRLTELQGQIKIFSSLSNQIDLLIMKRSEMLTRIAAATAEIEQGNTAIEAEFQQQAGNVDPEVTPEEEQSVIALEAAAAKTKALADNNGGDTSGGDTSGAAPVQGIPPFTTDADGNRIDAIGQRVDANGNVIPTQGV